MQTTMIMPFQLPNHKFNNQIISKKFPTGNWKALFEHSHSTSRSVERFREVQKVSLRWSNIVNECINSLWNKVNERQSSQLYSTQQEKESLSSFPSSHYRFIQIKSRKPFKVSEKKRKNLLKSWIINKLSISIYLWSHWTCSMNKWMNE